jgi:parallel beta-helix repeat protein
MKTKSILQLAADRLYPIFSSQFSTAFAQGSLTPPGAAGPTMISLDQMEPRTPVDATHTPGNTGSLFIIKQPGSYFLTGKITGITNQNGILIVTNGTGISASTPCTVSVCTASGNGVGGISATSGCRILDNTAHDSTGDGIQFIGRCLVTGNNVFNNTVNGIHVAGGFSAAATRIDANLAGGNAGAGILWVNDLVARNGCFLNGVNYSPAVGGGNTGPVQAASRATNPGANC